MALHSLFSKEEINVSRQPSLDYAKGLAIVFMVICHTVLMYAMGMKTWRTSLPTKSLAAL